MARPPKDGIVYFPFDVDFFADKKIRLLKGEFNSQAQLIYIMMLCEIYQGNGYFAPWDKDACLLMSEGVGGVYSPQQISEVVQGCLRRSLFDEGVFKVFGVLTSRGIQRRYIRAISTRDEISIIKEYWLLDVTNKKDVPQGLLKKIAFKSISTQNNPVTLQRNPEDLQINPKSKGKESILDTPELDAPVPPDDKPKGNGKRKKSHSVFAEDSEEMNLSRLLAKWMRKNNPKCKIPTSTEDAQRWCRYFDKIMRIDGYTFEEVRQMVIFSQCHIFWKKNILSPCNLRDKWDRLVLEKQEAEEKADGDVS